MDRREGSFTGRADALRPWSDLRDTGLLWLINRTVLHPRGFALALHFDEADEAVGWGLFGDGREPWGYVMDDEENDRFRRAMELLRPDEDARRG